MENSQREPDERPEFGEDCPICDSDEIDQCEHTEEAKEEYEAEIEAESRAEYAMSCQEDREEESSRNMEVNGW